MPIMRHRTKCQHWGSGALGRALLAGSTLSVGYCTSLCGPQRSTKFPLVQHDKLWPTSILVRLPSCLELAARTSATNHFNRPFQALSKNVFIRDILFNGLYKFTYLFTYFTVTPNEGRKESKRVRGISLVD